MPQSTPGAKFPPIGPGFVSVRVRLSFAALFIQCSGKPCTAMHLLNTKKRSLLVRVNNIVLHPISCGVIERIEVF